MSAITIVWAGGEHDFLLNIEQLRALQQRCDAGPQFVLNRLRSGSYLVDDIIQTIRLGLIGGGMDSGKASALVTQHVEERPITLSVLAAQMILMAALYGTGDDPVGEASGEATQEAPTTSPTGAGSSLNSTETASSSA